MTGHDAGVQTFYRSAFAADTSDLIVAGYSAVVDTADNAPVTARITADAAGVVVVVYKYAAVVIAA